MLHRSTSIRVIVTAAAVACLFAGSFAGQACSCPFCDSPTIPLAEQLAMADAVVLVSWTSATKPEKDKPGSTTFTVIEAVRDPLRTHPKGTQIALAGFRSGKSGDLSLVFGTKGTTIEWGPPIEVTETVFNYVVQAPAPDVATPKRLEYYVKFLEFPDPAISADAFAEFANAPYKDILPLVDKLPRDKLRKWVASMEISENRIGLYGMLLGLCGGPEDVALMESRIAEIPSPQTIRKGIEGVMGGYLLLTGEKGLEFLERTKMTNKECSHSEAYASILALRFMWAFGENRISKDRLRASMRILLRRPELADIVIGDLARWKDWSVSARLMEIYDDPAYDVPSVKRAVVKFMFACTKDMKPTETPPEHVATAKRLLETLRKQDAKIVRTVELNPGL